METENNETTEIITEDPVEAGTESGPAPGEPATDVVSVEDLLPALRGALAENNVQLAETMTETLTAEEPDTRPFMTTEFNDYSVTEGLLLVIAVLLVLNFFLTIIRRWF